MSSSANTLPGRWDGYDEWVRQSDQVWEFFGRRKEGFFIEVGANDPEIGSQTFHLEEQGWSGILVEPQVSLVAQLKARRTRSKVVHAACTSREKSGQGVIHLPKNAYHGFATTDPTAEEEDVEFDRQEPITLVTLDSILEEAVTPAVDLLSVDTQGTELDVLRGFNLGKYRPRLILLEDHVTALDKHRYLQSEGYKLVRRTELNNWYIPEEAAPPKLEPGERLKLFRKVFLGMPFRKLRAWRHRRQRLAK